MRSRDTLASFVLAGVLAFVGAGRAHALWELAKAQDRLPQWDMAHNALLGLELARDLGDGRLLAFLRDLNAHTTWPFGYSLLLVPFFLAKGPAFSSAVLAVVTAFAALPLALGWVCREADRGARGAWVALLSSALVLASPLLQLLSILVLREIVGALALVVAAALYLRARRKGTLAAWRVAGLATLGVVFVKYNYGAMWIAAAFLDSLLERGEVRVPRRALVETVAIPLLVWLLIPVPNHLGGMLGFLSNRDSSLPIGASLLYYPRVLLAQYAPSPAIGAAVLALFGVGLVLAFRGVAGRWRLPACVAAVHVAATVLHPYKEARFLATTVPWIFLLASLPVAAMLGRLLRSRPARVAAASALAAGLVLLVVTASGAWVQRTYAEYSVDRRVQVALDALGRLADRDAPVGVLGTFNELSPALVEWTLVARDNGPAFEVVRRMPRVREGEDAAAALERWLAKRGPRQVLAIALDPDSPVRLDRDYREHNLWQERASAALDLRGDFLRDASEPLPALGMTIHAYRRTSPVAGR